MSARLPDTGNDSGKVMARGGDVEAEEAKEYPAVKADDYRRSALSEISERAFGLAMYLKN